MTQPTTAIKKTLELLIEYGLVSEGTDPDQQILIGVTTLLTSWVKANRRILALEDDLFRAEAMLGETSKLSMGGWH